MLHPDGGGVFMSISCGENQPNATDYHIYPLLQKTNRALSLTVRPRDEQPHQWEWKRWAQNRLATEGQGRPVRRARREQF